MALQDLYKVTFRYHVVNEFCDNSIYFRETVASTSELPARSLALALQTVWIPTIASAFAEDTVLDSVYVRRTFPTRAIPHEHYIGQAGTAFPRSLPPTVGVAITQYGQFFAVPASPLRRTNVWSGVSEEDQVTGLLTVLGRAVWQGLALVYTLGVNAIGGEVGGWFPVCVLSPGPTNVAIDAAYARPNLVCRHSRRRHAGLALV